MITIKKPIKKIISDISDNLCFDEEEVNKIIQEITNLSEKYIYVFPKKCVRCGLCYEECPVDAITKPTVRKPAEIIPEKCVKCEICAKTCPVDAIEVLDGEAYLNGDSIIYKLKETEVQHRTVRLKKYDIDLENCIKCGICDRYCPTKAIHVERRKSFDVNLDLCVGCKACENVCPKKVIKVQNELGEIPFNKDITVDNDTCIKCLACIDECPVNAIDEIKEGVEINKLKCIFCGRCENVCPVHAIEIRELNKDIKH